MGFCSDFERSEKENLRYLRAGKQSMSSDVTLHRISTLVSRYQNLGTFLRNCIELAVRDSKTLRELGASLDATEKEMAAWEASLADCAEDAMVLQDDLRRGKFSARRRAVGIACNTDADRKIS